MASEPGASVSGVLVRTDVATFEFKTSGPVAMCPNAGSAAAERPGVAAQAGTVSGPGAIGPGEIILSQRIGSFSRDLMKDKLRAVGVSGRDLADDDDEYTLE